MFFFLNTAAWLLADNTLYGWNEDIYMILFADNTVYVWNEDIYMILFADHTMYG